MDNDYFDVRPGAELSGRMLTNCFGIEEKAVLEKYAWRYYDWCVQQGFDMRLWVKIADEKRAPQLTFSENLNVCLWADEIKRFRDSDVRPPWPEPEGYDEYLEIHGDL